MWTTMTSRWYIHILQSEELMRWRIHGYLYYEVKNSWSLWDKELIVTMRRRTHGHYEMKNSWSVYDEEFMITVFGLKICLFNGHTSNIQFKLDSHFNNRMIFLKENWSNLYRYDTFEMISRYESDWLQ